MSRARELGFSVVSCASTGNLANSVAANAAACGMENYVFIPRDLERSKILGTLVYGSNVVGIKGTYDEVNRLCSEIAGRYGWAFVNINISGLTTPRAQRASALRLPSSSGGRPRSI